MHIFCPKTSMQAGSLDFPSSSILYFSCNLEKQLFLSNDEFCASRVTILYRKIKLTLTLEIGKLNTNYIFGANNTKDYHEWTP